MTPIREQGGNDVSVVRVRGALRAPVTRELRWAIEGREQTREGVCTE